MLDRYLDGPDCYSVSGRGLSAVDMWSVSLGRTSTGDVEIYLGDLGRDIPWQEHDHWKAHNIVPRSEMNPDRYKRDFLGQFAVNAEPLQELRDSLRKLNIGAERVWGRALFRPLPLEEANEFDRMHPPVHKGNHALVQPILLLTKALVDAIDVKLIKDVIGSSEGRSVALVGELVEHLGGDASVIDPRRYLYRLRSSDGIAYLAESSRSKTLVSVGLEGLTPADAINAFAARIAASLTSLADAIESSATT